MTRSAAKEVGKRRIRVNAVAPGAIVTPLLHSAYEILGKSDHLDDTAMPRQGTAEEVGSVIAFLLGPESTFVTGMVYGADGGWDC